MNLSLLLSQLFNGLQTGSIYALVALGYSMVYGIILLLNFAHGDIIMVGAYAAFYAMTNFHLHPDRKSTRLNSSHNRESRMPSSA